MIACIVHDDKFLMPCMTLDYAIAGDKEQYLAMPVTMVALEIAVAMVKGLLKERRGVGLSRISCVLSILQFSHHLDDCPHLNGRPFFYWVGLDILNFFLIFHNLYIFYPIGAIYVHSERLVMLC